MFVIVQAYLPFLEDQDMYGTKDLKQRNLHIVENFHFPPQKILCSGRHLTHYRYYFSFEIQSLGELIVVPIINVIYGKRSKLLIATILA